jgi:hypothetical protein
MIAYRTSLRVLIPTAFVLGVGTAAACLYVRSSFRDGPRISESFALSNAPDRARIAFRLPSLEARPTVAKRMVRCRVHRAELKSMLVGIEHGFRLHDDRHDAYLTAREASFPHCDDAIWGGCVGGTNEEDLKEVCQECNAARDMWLREHSS